MRYYELLESLTSGEFTFGFELEAIFKNTERYFDPEESTTIEFLEDNLLQEIESYGVFGNIVNDNSIKTKKHEISFEFVSNPVNFNSKNLTSMFKLLSNLKNLDVYTNESCGFHIHVKYPGLSKNDIRWIVACISMNPDYQDITMGFKDYDFYDLEYASPEFYQELENVIEYKSDEDIRVLLDDSKYRVLRIHPQGTLEWRGPRNFLNSGDSNIIHDFVIHLFGYIRMIMKCLDQNSVGGYSKKDFYDIFKDTDKINLNPNQIKFIKNYSGKEKNIAKELVTLYPNILDVKFKSPPKIYMDSNDKDVFKIEGDVIGGVWDLPFTRVIFMKGNFSNATFKNGYFNGNWIPSSTWINGITGSGYTYDGKKVPNDVTPKTWEEYLDNKS